MPGTLALECTCCFSYHWENCFRHTFSHLNTNSPCTMAYLDTCECIECQSVTSDDIATFSSHSTPSSASSSSSSFIYHKIQYLQISLRSIPLRNWGESTYNQPIKEIISVIVMTFASLCDKHEHFFECKVCKEIQIKREQVGKWFMG